MKKSLFIFGAILFVVFSMLLISKPPKIILNEADVIAPNKPGSVPDNVFWVGGVDGGNFISISKVERMDNLYSARIYNDYSGDLEYDGLLKYSGNKMLDNSLSDPTLFLGWDGEKLHLTNNEYMSIYKNKSLTNGSARTR